MKRLALIAAAVTLATPALAIDFTRPLTQIDGKPFKTADGKDDASVTLGTIALGSLLQTYPDEDRTITPEEKFKRGKLAMKISDAIEKKQDLPLQSEDVALLKKLIGKNGTPLVVVQTMPMLDPNAEK